MEQALLEQIHFTRYSCISVVDSTRSTVERLVVEINYALQIIFIRFVGAHQDYDAVDVETI